jgi:predicted unusual protein kinase regulating ubiquinone biosynthesis (AarF/ABC1/UbiB family)
MENFWLKTSEVCNMKEQNNMSVSKVERSMKFVKTGFKVGGNYVKHYSKKLVNPEMNRDELDRDNAADIYDTLSNLKGSALKVAQMLSMDKSVLPRAYADQFALSLNSAPPLSGPLIVRTFTKSFGKTPEELFDRFEMKATHAASIGQVHKAWKDGQQLAVKIQYPGVADSISSDLKLVKPFALRLLGMSEAELAIYLKEVEEKLVEETNYRLELSQGVFISEACKDLENIYFPTYLEDLSNDRILVMEWLDGKPLKEWLRDNPSPEERDRVGQALWDFYNFQQHELKVIHADPHPGNFIISESGDLGVVDFGCTKVIPGDFYHAFFGLVDPAVHSDKDRAMELFRELQMILPGDGPKETQFFFKLYSEMIDLFARPYREPEFDFGDPSFINALYEYGERVSKMPELRQARGVKHFIYVNRTNFGLYNILHELKARVKTNTFKIAVHQPSTSEAI